LAVAGILVGEILLGWDNIGGKGSVTNGNIIGKHCRQKHNRGKSKNEVW